MELTSFSNYQLRLKNINEDSQLKQNIEIMMKDIYHLLGKDVFIDLNIEAQNLKKRTYSAVLCLFGKNEKIVVRKEAKILNSLLKKLRRLSLRKIKQDLGKQRSRRYLKPG